MTPRRLEDAIRRALHDDPDRAPATRADTEAFLSRVHRGARRRRTRRLVTGTVLVCAAVGAGGYAVDATGVLHDAAPSGDSPTAGGTVSTGPHGGGAASTLGAVGQTRTRGRFLSLSATGTDAQYVLSGVTRRGCPTTGCATLSVTKDAGRHWTRLRRLPAAAALRLPSPGAVSSVRFAGSGRDGWAYGGGLLSTHDGGRTWSRPRLPVNGVVTRLEAWGDVVYAVVGDPASRTARLLRSPAGRDRWSVAALGTSAGWIDALAVSQRVVGVLVAPSSSPGHASLLTSTDGVTWSPRSPCGGGASPSDLATTSDSLWAVCSRGLTTYVAVSTDAGRSWQPVPGRFTATDQVAARDSTTAVVTDPARPGLTVVAVGAAVQRVTGPALTGVTPIGFTNPSTGYLENGSAAVLRTSDGGATWSTYPLPP